jgi:hypothetical protein
MRRTRFVLSWERLGDVYTRLQLIALIGQLAVKELLGLVSLLYQLTVDMEDGCDAIVRNIHYLTVIVFRHAHSSLGFAD